MLRLALAFVALTSLGACNMLMTKTPVFAASDAAGAPTMRLGVWGPDPKSDCQVDETQPLADWPSCASGFVVLPDFKMGAYADQNGKKSWQTTPYLLASGDPRVFQVLLTPDMGELPMPSLYVYAAMKPTKFDDDGHIVAALSWAVICGPPPAADAKAADGTQQMGTSKPFAGLTMDDKGVNCTATAPDAVRGAARASRAFAAPGDITGSHWVRDGDK